MEPSFCRFIGIDYSGAQHCDARLSGLRVFEARISEDEPIEIRPFSNKPRQNWTRKEIAHWLTSALSDESQGPCLVGIDHALSFPIEYFALHSIEQSWDSFLDDFCAHWPTDDLQITVKDILKQQAGAFESRCGNARWRRLTDKSASGAKSVFHFGVPGSVASSTHAGIPWIRYLRGQKSLRHKIHFWPFDGWKPPPHKSLIAEVYPSLWNKQFSKSGLTQDQHDARCVAIMLRDAFVKGEVERWFSPDAWRRSKLSKCQLQIAQLEGWILGLD